MPPPTVTALLDALLADIRNALGDNLLGVYLCGSLALGDFDPASSDVDTLFVTAHPLSREEIARLAVVAGNFPPSGNHFGLEYEAYLIDSATIRRFVPGQRHVKIASDEPLDWIEHRPCWVIERWIVREHGIRVLGPDPKTLIDPVAPHDLREAAAGELQARLAHWRDGTWPMSEMAHRGAQAFEVEMVCRALHTMDTGEAAPKRVAVDWALETLPGRWHGLIDWSRQHKKEQTQDPTRVPEVLEFLAWAAQGEVGRSRPLGA